MECLSEYERRTTKRARFVAKHRHDPVCPDCNGRGSDTGSDGSDGTLMRDGNSLKPCRTCKGSGDNPHYTPV